MSEINWNLLTSIGDNLVAGAKDYEERQAPAEFARIMFGGPGNASPAPALQATPEPAPVAAQPKVPTFAAIEGDDPSRAMGGLVRNVSAKYGLAPDYLPRVAQIESNGDPKAINRQSGAAGLFQFMPKTAAGYGLRNPFDPEASTDAAARLTADNRETLRSALGREPTSGELYLAHQQGATGAARLLKNPDAPAVALVGPNAVAWNGGDKSMKAGDFASLWTSKFDNGDAVTATGDAVTATGGAGVAPAGAPAPAALPPQVDGARAKIQAMLSSSNPDVQKYGMAMAQKYLVNDEYGFQVVDGQLVRTSKMNGTAQVVPGIGQPATTTVSPGSSLVTKDGKVVYQNPKDDKDAYGQFQDPETGIAYGYTKGDPNSVKRLTPMGPDGAGTPGVSPKKLAEARAGEIAKAEAGALKKGEVAQTTMPIVDRALSAYQKLNDMGEVGPVVGSAPMRAVSALGHKDHEAIRQEYEAAAKDLELMQAQLKMKGQGAITEGERRILALTLPRLDAINGRTGLTTLQMLRKQMDNDLAVAQSSPLASPSTGIRQPGAAPAPQAPSAAPAAAPPVPGARMGSDKQWYVPDPNRAGKYLRVN